MRSDLLAGLTLAAIAIPEQMATARLANVAVVTGLYAFVAGSLAFALLGSNPRTSIGADSTITPVFAAGVVAVAAVGTPAYAHLVTFFALVVAALLVAIGLLRLGWIADFLSAPVITGILAGIAIDIVVRQLPAVTGIHSRGTTTIGELRALWAQRGQLDGRTIAIAAGVLVVVMSTERLDRRLPGPLLGLGLSMGAVAVFSLAAHGASQHGVDVVGVIHSRWPTLGAPSVTLHDVRHLVGPALAVAFVCVMQTAATSRLLPNRGGPGVRALDRDLVALGAGNLLAGLGGSFPVNASPPRTAAVATVGGRSQATGLVAVAVVAVVVLFAGTLLKDLPQATLGAILVFVATKLWDGGELRAVLRFDRVEFGLSLVTIVVVALVGIEQGVVVAIVLALAQRARLLARPRDAILGRLPGTDHWVPVDVGEVTEQIPGVVVYLLYAPLWYGNADYVHHRVLAELGRATTPVRRFVLDADGISDVDYTGAQALRQLAEVLIQRGVTLAVARTSHVVHHNLRLGGLLEQIGVDEVYSSVASAVGSG